MAPRKSDSGRQAIIWLATLYIVLIGAGASAFVIVSAAEQPQGPLIICGVIFAGLTLMLLAFQMRWEQPMNRLKFWLSSQRRSDPTDDYRVARRRIKLREAQEQLGGNGPPTVESVRDAANHGGAWVPHSNKPEEPPRGP